MRRDLGLGTTTPAADNPELPGTPPTIRRRSPHPSDRLSGRFGGLPGARSHSSIHRSRSRRPPPAWSRAPLPASGSPRVQTAPKRAVARRPPDGSDRALHTKARVPPRPRKRNARQVTPDVGGGVGGGRPALPAH